MVQNIMEPGLVVCCESSTRKPSITAPSPASVAYTKAKHAPQNAESFWRDGAEPRLSPPSSEWCRPTGSPHNWEAMQTEQNGQDFKSELQVVGICQLGTQVSGQHRGPAFLHYASLTLAGYGCCI